MSDGNRQVLILCAACIYWQCFPVATNHIFDAIEINHNFTTVQYD